MSQYISPKKFEILLKKRRLTPAKLAKAMNINVCNLSVFKSGRQNVQLRVLKKYCVFFHCTPNDLIDHEGWLKDDTVEKPADPSPAPEL